MRDDLTVVLTGTDALTYRRCLRDLFDAVAEKQILSRNEVVNVANGTCANIFRKGMFISRESPEFHFFCDNELKELRKALERQPVSWEIINRACGIDHAALPVKIGKMTFVSATPDELKSIPEASIEKSITTECFAGNVLGRLHVQAVDIDAARMNATMIHQQTIDCLNFFASVAGILGQAYFLGEKEKGHGLTISIAKEHTSHQSFVYGPLQLVPLNRLAERSSIFAVRNRSC
jgi:hypothetical protein